MSLGMNPASGRSVTDMEHLRQSVAQILSTPMGTRIERRPFGSVLPQLIDAPLNDDTRIRLYAATAGALAQFEPRLRVMRVGLNVDPQASHQVTLQIEGMAFMQGRQRAVSFSVPAWQGAGSV